MTILSDIGSKTLKAYSAFEKSLQRIQKLPCDPDHLTDDQAERWEAYCSRFGRLQDILVKRFFRAIALREDPAWSGTVRDLLNFMEKLHVIDAASDWLGLRELRNEMAHEYEESALAALHERARTAAPLIMAVKPKVALYAPK